MSSFIFYSFSVIVCSGVFMLLYHLFVSRKAGYTFCRRYLMAAMLLSVVIPTLNVPLTTSMLRWSLRLKWSISQLKVYRCRSLRLPFRQQEMPSPQSQMQSLPLQVPMPHLSL